MLKYAIELTHYCIRFKKKLFVCYLRSNFSFHQIKVVVITFQDCMVFMFLQHLSAKVKMKIWVLVVF